MRVIVAESYDEMSAVAFEILKEVVTGDPQAILGLATGSTPIGLYENMVRDHKARGTSYRRVRSVNLDEYVGLGAQDEQSYAYFMRKHLFDHIDIDLANTHIEDGKAPDHAAECARYNALLDGMRQDLQVLGIGSNGHIAFNEPGTSFDSETHIVDLTERTRGDNARMFADIKEVPQRALTMGIKNIMNAKKILVLASGANKARAVLGMVKGAVSEALPASVLQLHPDCVLVCDKQAAALLCAQVV